jgi:hypothetical protein
MLKEHFARPETIESPHLRNNIFKPDPENTVTDPLATKIKIEPSWRYDADDEQQRPAIYVRRNQVQLQRLAIADGLGIGKHSAMLVGSHTCFCVERSGEAAEILGYEVFRELNQFGPVVRSDFNMYRWNALQLTPVSILEEAEEHFVTGVIVGWAYNETWQIRKISPFLKKILVAGVAQSC